MENLQKKPSKGILKSSSSFEQQNECQSQPKPDQSTDKDIKWDEMNILQTLHPADKDYGHMKIEEPKTPFNYYSDTTDGEQLSDHESDGLDASSLADKIARKGKEMPKALRSSSEEDSDDENLTEEEKKKKRDFEVKRKMHYNEFQAVKLARKLLEEEDEDEDDGSQPPLPSHSADNDDSNHRDNHSKGGVFGTTGDEQNDSEDKDSINR